MDIRKRRDPRNLLNRIYLGQNGFVSVQRDRRSLLVLFQQTGERFLSERGGHDCRHYHQLGVYSPYVDKERCRPRRDWVLGRMLKQGWISEEQLLMVQAQPVETSGFENYAKRAPYFLDYLAQQLKALYPEEVLDQFGTVDIHHPGYTGADGR